MKGSKWLFHIIMVNEFKLAVVHLARQNHSRPQSPRSFWPVAGIESSGLVQHRKSAIHGLIVKSSKSDWLRIRNEYSAHAQKIGSRQSSRSLPQARRIVGSGDENARPNPMQTCACAWIYRWTKKCGKIRTGPPGRRAIAGRGPAFSKTQCYGAGRRRLSFGSFQKGLENRERTEK